MVYLDQSESEVFMIYVPETYSSYKYLVDYDDNFVVLTNHRVVSGSFDNPNEYDVIIQYFKPSTYTIATSRITRSTQEFESIEVSSDFYDRADCPELMICIFICIFFILFLVNGVTRLVKRGGIFFGQ